MQNNPNTIECKFDPVRNWLLGAAGSLLLAGVFAAGAIISLAFPWWWDFAKVLAWACVVSIGLAAVLVNQARVSAKSYYECKAGGTINSDTSCWGDWRNFRNSLDALTASIATGATVAAQVAGSLMGWWSAPQLIVVVGALFINGVLIISTIAFFFPFKNCVGDL